MNAHTGKVERTWNNLQNVDIKGIIGNNKIGNKTVMMSVETEEDDSWCRHRDADNRVEVSKDLLQIHNSQLEKRIL